MSKSRGSLTTLGLASLWLLGCATHAVENRRLIDELGRYERSASDDRRRIAELEWRLREIEAQREAESRRASARELSLVLDRLDTVITQNQQLLHPSAGAAAATARDGAPEDDANPKVQLRYWAERLRSSSSGFRGGLTPEQSAALKVLLRQERRLDPKNPWPDI